MTCPFISKRACSNVHWLCQFSRLVYWDFCCFYRVGLGCSGVAHPAKIYQIFHLRYTPVKCQILRSSECRRNFLHDNVIFINQRDQWIIHRAITPCLCSTYYKIYNLHHTLCATSFWEAIESCFWYKLLFPPRDRLFIFYTVPPLSAQEPEVQNVLRVQIFYSLQWNVKQSPGQNRQISAM